jgi:flagellar hook-associated protein 2
MANVSSVGIGSGVLTSDLIDKLVTAEKDPTEKRLDARQDSVTAELSIFAQIQSAVTDLRLPARNLANPDTFNQLSVSSGSAAFTARASSDAVAANYSLEVISLAKSQSLSSGTFADSDTTAIGEGTLNITIGGQTTSILIDPANNTLEGIASAINEEAGLEASATVINNGSGFQLVITSNKTGAANAIDVSVSDTGGGSLVDSTGLSRLSYTTGANGQQLTLNQAATDASIKFNGIPITRETNTIDDLVAGLTIDLVGTNENAPAALKIERDTAFVTEKVKEFVDSYNALRQLITENSKIVPDNPAAAGLLVGDTATRTISNQIRNVLGGAIAGMENDSVRSLAEVGITTDRETGNFLFNENTFRSALESSPKSVSAIFSEQGRASDGQIEFVRAGSSTLPGTYDVNVTQIATRGAYTGSQVIGTNTLIDATNDEFSVKVDGISSGTIALDQKSYTQSELLAEIQSKINSDSSLLANKVSVTASYDVSGNLVLTSNTYGNISALEVLSAEPAAAASLGLSAGVGVDGVNVEGTIDGIAATGNGQFLSGPAGTDIESLQIKVNGGATGSRGDVRYIEGVGERLVDLINNFLGVDGTITAKNDRLNAELDSIAESRAKLELRIVSFEERLVRQFTAADILIARLNSTQDFIKGQLDALAASSQKD